MIDSTEVMERLLRATEVSAILRLSRAKVYELAAAGELPTVRIGTAVRFPEAALRRWISERTSGGAVSLT